eukprot:TRINITY_DN3011_c0_g1_i3.p1 TRINITY_DN3011_c0_g1~~TRINITY_DN3011_c0_g1_i3.p1  ORF type:complete len:391 (-),score=83.88 TRINITY_DN3011_c0_g1_i3:76-1248(-)
MVSRNLQTDCCRNHVSRKLCNAFTTVKQMGVYKTYISNHENATHVVDTLLRESTNFQEFHLLMKRKFKLPLQSYLILPVQRLPRYELMLKEYMKELPPWSKYHTALKRQKNGVAGLLNAVNAHMRFTTAKEERLNFVRSLLQKQLERQGIPWSDDAHIVVEGDAQAPPRSDVNYAMLLPQCLVLARREHRPSGETLAVAKCVATDRLIAVSIATDADTSGTEPPPPCCFASDVTGTDALTQVAHARSQSTSWAGGLRELAASVAKSASAVLASQPASAAANSNSSADGAGTLDAVGDTGDYIQPALFFVEYNRRTPSCKGASPLPSKVARRLLERGGEGRSPVRQATKGGTRRAALWVRDDEECLMWVAALKLQLAQQRRAQTGTERVRQ